MALSMQRRPRRYSASRRGVRGRIGGGSGGWQFTPPGNMIPVAPPGAPGAPGAPVPPGVLPPPPGGAVPPGSIAQPAPEDQPPPGPPPAAGYGGQNNPSNPYAGTNYNYGGSPTQADKAIINGVEVWAGGPYSGQPVAKFPNGGDLTPYLKNPGQAPPADSVAGGAKIDKPLVQSPPAGTAPTAPAAGATVQPSGPVKYDPSNPAQAAAAAANAKNVKPGQVPKWVGPGGVLIYDAGGLVDEPVLAKGARSGKTYLFIGGEKITPMDTGLSARHHSPASAAAPSSAPLKRPGKG